MCEQYTITNIPKKLDAVIKYYEVLRKSGLKKEAVRFVQQELLSLPIPTYPEDSFWGSLDEKYIPKILEQLEKLASVAVDNSVLSNGRVLSQFAAYSIMSKIVDRVTSNAKVRTSDYKIYYQPLKQFSQCFLLPIMCHLPCIQFRKKKVHRHLQ